MKLLASIGIPIPRLAENINNTPDWLKTCPTYLLGCNHKVHIWLAEIKNSTSDLPLRQTYKHTHLKLTLSIKHSSELTTESFFPTHNGCIPLKSPKIAINFVLALIKWRNFWKTRFYNDITCFTFSTLFWHFQFMFLFYLLHFQFMVQAIHLTLIFSFLLFFLSNCCSLCTLKFLLITNIIFQFSDFIT